MTNSTPGNDFVADTVAVVLRLEHRRTGNAARAAFDAMEAGMATIHIPAMVLAEVLYLSEKKHITISLADVSGYVRQHHRCKQQAMSLRVVKAAAQITDIPELHDRLIAGTARLLGVPLVTNDSTITASAFVRTIW